MKRNKIMISYLNNLIMKFIVDECTSQFGLINQEAQQLNY